MLLLLLACTGAAPAPEAIVTGAGGGEPAPSEPVAPVVPAFDAWPEDPALLPAPSLVAQSLSDHGILASSAEHAASVSYKTDVSVSMIAAARTGAEIGALVIEASVVEPAKLAERVQRIQAGLASLDEESLALQDTANLLVFLSQDPSPEQVRTQLDQLHAKLLLALEAESDSSVLPVLLAGAWMQAYHLMALGLESTENPGPGHELFYRPPVGAYFSAYVEGVGQGTIPSGMLEPLEGTLDNLRERTEKDPMSAEDLAMVRQGLGDILGML